MSRRISLATCAWLIVFCAGVAPAAEKAGPSRVGKVLFYMPDGWQRGTADDGSARLSPSNAPAGQSVEVRLPEPIDLAGTLAQTTGDYLRVIAGRHQGVQAGQVVSQRHRNGYDYQVTTMSWQNDAAPGEFVYEMVFMAGVGKQAQPVLVVCNNPASYNAQREVIQRFFDGLSFTPLVKLAHGDPPLTQATVDDVTDFLEWLLEVPFTDEQKQTIRDSMTDAWKRQDKEEINGTAETLQARARLSAMTAEQRALVRETVRTEALKQWRADKDPASKLMVSIYDAAHQPLVAGDPPLTRQQADAACELLYFMASQCAGIENVQPTQAIKDAFAKGMAEAYPQFDEKNKAELSQVPLVWAAVRVVWTEVPEEQRTAARAQWAKIPQVAQVSQALKKMSQQAAASSEGGSAVELMKKLQTDRENFMALNRASYDMHMASMTVAANMGGHYHYEYRYR